MSLYVTIIADYGPVSDMAFAEVMQALAAEMGDIENRMYPYGVPAFDTVATGFVLAECAINSKLGENHKFFVNTAPRKDALGVRKDNQGEGLAYVKLHNGVEIVAVNSGYSLSLVKEAAEEIRVLNVSDKGSQFRSRDIFPLAFGQIVHGNYDGLGRDLRGDIPDFPADVVCYTDGYGNIKTSVDPETLEDLIGQQAQMDVNHTKHTGKISRGIFGVPDGQLCLSRGSSGWALPDGTRRCFTEIVKRGGNAARDFQKPPGGVPVRWKVVDAN